MPLGSLALLALALAGPPLQEAEAYGRVVARALERVQAELLATTRVEVDHSRWEDPWVVASEHYEVRTTAGYLQARRMVDGLELMHAEFVKLLGQGDSAPAGRQRVWILPGIADYNRFGEENGAEHSSILGSFYASDHGERPVVACHDRNETLLWMWVTHSAVHQFLEQNFGPQRHVWIDEGLASYFALRWDWGYGARELERIEKGTFVPLQRLVSEPIQAYATRPDERFVQLGMLFHYFLNSCEATRNGAAGEPDPGPFQEFLRAAVRGQALGETEFMQTLEDAAEELEEDFRNFDFEAK